jgi:hypothetical protein
MVPNLIQGISQQPASQRDPTQGVEQINGVSSISDGLRKRQGTRAVALLRETQLGDVFFHAIQRDASEQYLVAIGRTRLWVYDLEGNERAIVAPSGFGYLSKGTSSIADFRAASIADYTFISNTKVVPEMSRSVAPKTARPKNEALLWIKAANYGQTYRANVNGSLVEVVTAVAPVVVSGGVTTENRISARDIAEQFRIAISSIPGITVTRNGSVLYLSSDAVITIGAVDARANADITAITTSVQSFTELPTIAKEGYTVEIVGDPGNKFDNYYVTFRPREGAGTFGEGAWEETVSPGVEYAIRSSTMPHALVRLPDGSFYFGPLNGSRQQGVRLPTWGERTAGDYETAPDPSFIGRPIQDIFVYKGRMGLLADENIILSRPGEFFEFFPETVTTTLDTDPIDVTASNNRVALLRYAVPYQDELILFSDMMQFRFGSNDNILTASSATVTVLTQYEIDPNCRPIQVAGAIIFCQRNGQFSQFREFSVRGAGTSLIADAADLTGYVSTYVPSEITQLASNDAGGVFFAISKAEGYRDRIYVHKFFSRGGSSGPERIQSSWSYWQIMGSAKVLQILTLNETLYLMIQYGEQVWLESVSAADRAGGGLDPTPLLLDRAVSTTEATPVALRVANGTYDPATKRTSWTLPYQAVGVTQAWTDYTEESGGILLGETCDGNAISAGGDWRDAAVWFGQLYPFLYVFNDPMLFREIGGGKAASNVETVQLRHALLRYHRTQFFEVVVQAERREQAVYTFDGVILKSRYSKIGEDPGDAFEPGDGRLATGAFRIPIYARGDRVVLSIVNDTAKPCRFTTLEWVGAIKATASRLQ